MSHDLVRELASCLRGSVEAPAGCGKTHLIASAVATSHERQLVLTHTHAGVHAIRSTLTRLGADKGGTLTRLGAGKGARVDTIAGFALRFASAYPRTSQLLVSQPRSDEEWASVYEAAVRVLDSSVGASVLRASYGGAYVDEYQDCTRVQHRIVQAIADKIGCRVLGDPLQGIFDFHGELVDWHRDVEPEFGTVGQLEQPWRWKRTNPALGDWLLVVRQKILAGEPIDLRRSPATWVPAKRERIRNMQMLACFDAVKRGGTVVAIMPWPQQCAALAGCLRGAYQTLEPIYAPDLQTAAADLGDRSGPARAALLLEFAKECATYVGTELASIGKAISQGRYDARIAKHRAVYEALALVATSDSPGPLEPALRACVSLPGSVVKRRDLLEAMLRTLAEFDPTRHSDLQEAAWEVRHRTSAVGRRLPQRIVSRTVLVKGLEFDHSLILDPTGLTPKHLYVALTRGSRSLVVVSESPILQPVETTRKRRAEVTA